MFRQSRHLMQKCSIIRHKQPVKIAKAYRRLFLSQSSRSSHMWNEYNALQSKVDAMPLPSNQDKTAIFCNNELNLGEIEVYGFDYDYTLACYTDSLHPLIYNLAIEKLVNDLKYPRGLLEYQFNPGFAIRGLHCDIQKGILLKIDAFHQFQPGCAYRGLTHVADDQLKSLYQGSHLNLYEMSNYYGVPDQGATFCQLMDLFAMPEMNLYANAIEHFDKHDIPCSPDYVFHDVRGVVQSLHLSGELHQLIMADLDRFVGRSNQVAEVLRRLSSADKKLFLITNSGFTFVDRGMRYLVGDNWRDLFDVIIVNARKPKFFNESKRPFRQLDTSTLQKSWYPVERLNKGAVYIEGNLFLLHELTGWHGDQVLYFGDHVYTDLAFIAPGHFLITASIRGLEDATIKHGWRTGAIIPELEREIDALNMDEFKRAVKWKLALEDLIQQNQSESEEEDPETQQVLSAWNLERHLIRDYTKKVFNPQFGSIFRTFDNPTYFSRRLNRFADIYTSSVVNLLHYSVKHTFFTKRSALAHEPRRYIL